MQPKAQSLYIVYWEWLGFGLAILMLWIDEILDVPHFLLGAAATPVNWAESAMESVFLLILALVVTAQSRRALSRIRYLEAFLRVCRQCKRIFSNGLWVPFDQYLSEQTDVRVSQGLCADCEKSLYSSSGT
jgi:hypothetical protein